MSRLVFAGALLLALVSGVSAGEFRVPGMRTNDVYYTHAGLKKALIGRMVMFENGVRVHFLSDGNFLYEQSEGAEPLAGRYVFSKYGLVCVKFETGASRCDTYVRSVRDTFVLTSGGKRWKVKAMVAE